MGRLTEGEKLGAVIKQELTLYRQEVQDRVDAVGVSAAKKLLKLTKAKAPTGKRGEFRRSISIKKKPSTTKGARFIWYVGNEEYRLTHLLVKGHATRDGGRTKPDPFLQDALAEVLPEYEHDVEEAVKG